jgi:hypothetical protein
MTDSDPKRTWSTSSMTAHESAESTTPPDGCVYALEEISETCNYAPRNVVRRRAPAALGLRYWMPPNLGVRQVHSSPRTRR